MSFDIWGNNYMVEFQTFHKQGAPHRAISNDSTSFSTSICYLESCIVQMHVRMTSSSRHPERLTPCVATAQARPRRRLTGHASRWRF